MKQSCCTAGRIWLRGLKHCSRLPLGWDGFAQERETKWGPSRPLQLPAGEVPLTWLKPHRIAAGPDSGLIYHLLCAQNKGNFQPAGSVSEHIPAALWISQMIQCTKKINAGYPFAGLGQSGKPSAQELRCKRVGPLPPCCPHVKSKMQNKRLAFTHQDRDRQIYT